MSLDVGAEHCRAIGRVVIEFQALEVEVSAAIWSLLNPNSWEPGKRVTSALSFRDQLNLLERLYQLEWGKNPPTQERLDAFGTFLQRARAVNDERNQIVHSYWIADNGRDVATRYKFRKSGKWVETGVDLSVAQIDNLADRISYLGGEFAVFAEAELLRVEGGDA